MKFVILFICIAMCINLSVQMVQFIKCSKGAVSMIDPTLCTRVTCLSDQKFNMIGCADYKCQPGKQIGYKPEDNTKVYPDCCGGPICAN